MSKLYNLLTPLSRKLSTASPKSETKLSRVIHHSTHRFGGAKRLQYEYPPTRKKCIWPTVQIKITPCESITSIEKKKDVIVDCENTKDIHRNGVTEKRYLNVLGRGGFGTVVKGVYKGETVAVKVSRKGLMPPGEENALNLEHRNVLKTLFISERKKEKDHFKIIIMEYFPNSQPLITLIENSEYSMAAKLLTFSKDIVEGLWYCHRNGVLHLDVKPQNILVCDGICKICDFGSSRKPDHQNGFVFQGTSIYAAPELLLGCKPTEKCDIYSLGITFWQLKNRKRPYLEFEDMETIIYKVVKFNMRPEENAPDGSYSSLYQRCWNRNPDDRPTSFEVLKILFKSCF